MTESSGYTLASTIVESHDAAVRKRQLNLALALLAGNLTSNGTVHLVGQPVLTSHSLKLKHAAYILVEYVVLAVLRLLLMCIFSVTIVAFHCLVAHNGLRRVTEHLGYVEVERLNAVALLE